MASTSKYHLKELLSKDQEPFVLNNFIHDRRSQSTRRNSTLSNHLCRNVCFVCLQHTPPTKSPLFNFSASQPKDTLFVHIPAKTAALLLEAAMRIQSQTEQNPKPKSSKNIGFGLFGSILKRLKRRKKTEADKDCDIKVSVKDILEWDSGGGEEREVKQEKKTVSDVGLSCSCNSSAAWTEMETSTSKSEGSEEEETQSSVVHPESESTNFDVCDKGSPFRFIISPRRMSPELLSPATSPNRRKYQVAGNDVGHLPSDEQERKEEKEHYCSPVSVLDLEIDDDCEVQDENELEDEDDGELERSFAFVHKAKEKLLQKLRRFELLAELDPLELEKRIAEDKDECEDEDDSDFDDDVVLHNNEKRKGFDGAVFRGSNYCNRGKAPLDMKRLLIDLMNEEGAVADFSERALAGNKRCKRLNSLKDLERDTVNMMVEKDFRGERNEWQRNSVHVEETVVEVEFAIFGFLVEELSVELCSV